MYDVIALGELLIDFTPSGISNSGNPLFEQNAGGAPANVLAALSKLGKQTTFIGKVGQDQFGEFLQEELVKSNIDTKGLIFADDVPTTLAFVHLDSFGDRSFSFYRNPSADMTLSKEDISIDLIKKSKIFHFGSLSMTHEAVAEATLYAVKNAKKENKLISFDPNLRASLWGDLSHAKYMIEQGLRLADIVKVSEEELLFVIGISDLEKASDILHRKYGIPLIFVTLGEKGCFYRHGSSTGHVPGFSVEVIDTTGAGDAFLGGILYQLLNVESLSELSHQNVRDMTMFANAVGAIVTTKKGALSSMPTLGEVNSLLEGQRKLGNSFG
ncbi:carbohydrate kinase family protein [Lederbergia citrea]|uniref:carbohydrate kinase family protein n=1 Tax=Lederbergia citrea TaxID=2833581 RepID=UPI001BC94F8E|nr:carbohydrate kinase [Lederbergia citrea]MBS4178139.1 carbohydrate kinase [Lederbergia citrea]